MTLWYQGLGVESTFMEGTIQLRAILLASLTEVTRSASRAPALVCLDVFTAM